MKENRNFVLYEYNNQKGYSFQNEEKFFQNKILTHKLEYFANIDGETDIIKYSRCNNEKIVSYYTIRNGIALCGTVKAGKIEWKYMEGMTNYVIARFQAFKDNGITFVAKEINDLFNKNSYTRIKNR